MFVTVNEIDYELSTTLRTAAAIGSRFKSTVQALAEKLDSSTVEEVITILKLGLVDKTQGQQLSDAILDGGWGLFELYSHTTEYLLELSYPGSPEEKERQIAASPMREDQKNALREALRLPIKNLSGANDSGST